MAQDFTQGQKETLPRRILRNVGRLLVYVNSVQENPHGMRWVCQAPVCERISGKEITKLVMKTRDRCRIDPQKPDPHQNCGQSDRKNRQPFSLCKTRPPPLHRAQQAALALREKPNPEQTTNKSQVQSNVAVRKIVA